MAAMGGMRWNVVRKEMVQNYHTIFLIFCDEMELSFVSVVWEAGQMARLIIIIQNGSILFFTNLEGGIEESLSS